MLDIYQHLSLTVQAQTFYDDIDGVVHQLTKMESQLTTAGQVGLLPETLRVQQRQFMVCDTVFLLMDIVQVYDQRLTWKILCRCNVH